MLSSPLLHASDLPTTTEQTTSTDEGTAVEPLPSADEGTEVSPGSSENERTARRKFWQAIIIATVAVAIAVSALILVASNQGKKGK